MRLCSKIGHFKAKLGIFTDMSKIDLLKLMSLSSKKELINTQYFHMLYDIIN